MSSTKRMAALAISVANAKPLPYLQGALNSSRAFHQWALAMGYDSELLTDENNTPITVDVLRDKLTQILNATARTHRLAIYFAGHGLIREAEESLWLLSDWWNNQEAVNVELMRRRLYRYPVDQISIFADACSSLPANMDQADLDSIGVLGNPGEARSATVAVDRFSAAQDGAATYVIPAPDPADDRCLFTGVLIEGLWGTKPEAFSQLAVDKVTSSSLGEYLKREVPRVAETYGRTLNPSVSPTFPEGDNIYFDRGSGATAPPLPPWPPPPAPRFAHGAVERVTGYDDFHAVRVMELPDPAAERAQLLVAELRTQDRPTHFETGCGFAVEGDEVVAIWAPQDVAAERDPGGPQWWRLGSASGHWLDDPAAILMELASGNFAAVTALPKFIGSMVVDARGVAGLVYRETGSTDDVARSTEWAIGELERGGLRADAVADTAVALRQGKHADPVRGVISAYLYDSVGDIDSIRRMAAYYLDHDQPIPYDIALLGQLEGELRDGRILWATVPDVPAREPQTEAESAVRWSYAATQGGTGPIGGLWPWLRQGWSFLDDPSPDGSTLVLPEVAEIARSVTTARFATLDQTGGETLAGMLQLEPRG